MMKYPGWRFEPPFAHVATVAVGFAGLAPVCAHRLAAGGYPHAFREHHRRAAYLVLDGFDYAGEIAGVHQEFLDPQQAVGAPPKPTTSPTKAKQAKSA
jgi:hypothetical protein